MFKKISIVVLAVLAVFIFGQISYAKPADLSPEKESIIKQTCVSAQTVLQRIQHNDAATRVNRGQGYETIVSRLMVPLNTRTTSNGYNDSAPLLIDTTKNFQQALENFKEDYESYDNSVSAALRIKCQDKPADFYGYLEDARSERQKVSNGITNLAGLIGEYRVNVLKLNNEVQQ
ncbi:MAG: hypothetical protein AAB395_01065 [Patescibacteria group bacterium]